MYRNTKFSKFLSVLQACIVPLVVASDSCIVVNEVVKRNPIQAQICARGTRTSIDENQKYRCGKLSDVLSLTAFLFRLVTVEQQAMRFIIQLVADYSRSSKARIPWKYRRENVYATAPQSRGILFEEGAILIIGQYSICR